MDVARVLARLRLALLGAAAALAFADSSIVVLALPELLREFDASVQGVAWVVTSYNLVVAVAAAGLVWGAARVSAARLTWVGLLVFLGGSIACAVAGDLGTLVAARSVQGLGGAALLAGSLPVARALAANPEAGTRAWILAGAIGAAIGPAAGGVLTELFDWRAIFVAQVPVAALALLAPLRVRGAPREASEGTRALGRAGANAALALVSGALVGALFLVVVMLINVWDLSPLAAAAVVSAIPLGTLAARGHAAVTSSAIVVLGSLLLAAGLAALALVPGSRVAWVLGGLVLCGAGLGLTVPPLTDAALGGSGGATASVSARHVGLVLALLLVAPLLARDIERATTRAERAGAALVLDARLPVRTKVPLAVDLARKVRRTPNGTLPDFGDEFRRRRGTAETAGELRRLRRSLDGTIKAVFTRSFRRAFALSALLALLALAPLPLLRARRRLA